MFQLSKDANMSYVARIVQITNLRTHSNASRLLCTSIMGDNIIVGLDTHEGDIVVLFPVECSINSQFIAWQNGFEIPEMNADTTKKGYFNKYARVRCIKLRGEPSQGYVVPFSQLREWMKTKGVVLPEDPNAFLDTEFDTVGGVLICHKYVNIQQERRELDVLRAGSGKREKKKQKISRFDRLIEGQFSFTVEVPQLTRNIWRLSPEDVISVTEKLHGSSYVVSKVLVKKPLCWYEQLAKWVGISVTDTEYGILYSSRKVLKNRYFPAIEQNHFYGVDLWGEVATMVGPRLNDGLSVFGEVVGFLPGTSTMIQKNYDYGLSPGMFLPYVYRVTHTTHNGFVYEFTHWQIKEFCKELGLTMVPEHFYGKAGDLYPEIPQNGEWCKEFISRLSLEFLEKDCFLCTNSVPNEGICLRVETSLTSFDIFKYKSFRFLENETKSLDRGEVDIETQQCIESEMN